MQLDRITARIAPRTAWQAMDLGVRLYQHWIWPLTRLYILLSLPVLLLIVLVAGETYYWYGLLLFWWLKPLWERPLLEYCARALFSQPTSLSELIKGIPQHTFSGMLPWLLLRRLDPSRSFHLPITQLEKQRGDAYRQRVRVLSMGPSDQSSALTFVLIGIEQAAAAGFVTLVMMMMPNQYYLQDVDWLLGNESLLLWIGTGSYYLATCLIAPLYVCCGFALYLNKRTWLEGWDLEVGLRHIGSRRRQLLQRLTLLLIPFCVLVASASLSLPVHAEQEEPHTDTTKTYQDPRQQATEILADKEFTGLEIRESWKFKDLFDDSEEELSEEDISYLDAFFKWLKKVLGLDEAPDEEEETDDTPSLPTLAEIVRFLLWMLVVAALVWLLFKIQSLRPGRQKRREKLPAQTHVAGLDIRPESLPDDIHAHVLAALRDGETRLALSLLYRASLSRLLAHNDIELEAGTTEHECLQLLQQHGGTHQAQLAFLQKLTAAWISTAWAHRPATAEHIEELANHWPELFAQPLEQADVA